MHPALARLLVATFLLASIGCGDKTFEPEPPATLVLSPTRVTLTAIGQSAQFVAFVTGARDLRVSWASSDSAVVRVESGIVVARAVGNAVIRAALVTDPRVRDSAAVVVFIPTAVSSGAMPIVSVTRACALRALRALTRCVARHGQHMWAPRPASKDQASS